MASYINEIRGLIMEKTGVDPEEITDDSFFEDDLNIGELEFAELLEEIEERYELDDLIDKKDEIETVGDLMEILADRIE